MKKSMNAAALFALLLGSPALLSLQACTDLGETPVSAITPENFYRNEQEVLGGLASVYASLRSSLWNYYNLSEISSDEFIVPTRGSDWFDNGRWLQIHRQLWEANSSATGEDINGAWVDAFTGVARANVLLGAMANVSVTNQEVIDAEIRTLRAFYYYMLMDMFGGVPIVTTTDIVARERQVGHRRGMCTAALNALRGAGVLLEIGLDRVDAGSFRDGRVLQLDAHRRARRPGSSRGQKSFDPGRAGLAVQLRQVRPEIGAVADDRVAAHAVVGLEYPFALYRIIGGVSNGVGRHLIAGLVKRGQRQRDENHQHQAEGCERRAALQPLFAGLASGAAHGSSSWVTAACFDRSGRNARSSSSCSNKVRRLPRKT